MTVPKRPCRFRSDVRHGGPDYDAKYPDGIPTSLEISHRQLGTLSSGLVMYPLGHARHSGKGFAETLVHKFNVLARLGCEDVSQLRERVFPLAEKSAEEMRSLCSMELRTS